MRTPLPFSEKEGRVTEVLYLAAFCLYIIFSYLETTTFVLRDFEILYAVIRGAVFSVALIRLHRYRDDVSKATLLLLAIFLGLGMFYLFSRGDYMVLDSALFISGAVGISFRKIGILYFYIGCFISLAAVICSRTGFIADYRFLTNYGGDAGIRHSLGIIYPTDCFAHIFYLAIVWFIIRWKRVTFPEICVAAAIFGILFRLTKARADVIFAAVILAVMLVLKICKFKVPAINKKAACVITSIVMPSCALGIILITYFYDMSNALLTRIDRTLSYRLSLGKAGMDLYGFRLLGNASFFENGNANGGIRDYAYIFYDSAYVKYLFKYGVLLLIVLFALYAMIRIRMIKNDMAYGLLFITVLSLSYMIEHHLLELSYNITLLLLTADISTILQSPTYVNGNGRNGIMTKII